jgi:PAS domain S-box-containing protein
MAAGKTDYDFFPKDLSDDYFSDEQLIMQTGKSIINKEERGLDLEGNELIISTTKVPYRHGNGKIGGIVGIGRDITRQKKYAEELLQKTRSLQEINVLLEERQEEIFQQSEELLAQSENLQLINKELEKLSIVASKTDNVIIIMDRDANMEWVNEGFVKRYGMTLPEFSEKKGRNLRVASAHKDIESILEQVITLKEPVMYDAPAYDKSNKLIWSQTTISPILDSLGNITNLIVIDSDITLLKETEEERLKQKAEIENQRDSLRTLIATKDKFFNIIAHDLKNPFHTIMGFSDLLSRNFDSIPDVRKKEFISLIKDSSGSAYDLLENLLHWARSQTNTISYEPKSVDLSRIIEENLAVIKASAEGKNLRIDFDPAARRDVYGDENMLSTILRNLLSNAVKFTPSGGKIEITLKPDLKGIVCSIKDSGIGINEEQKERLFRLDQSFSGTGTAGETGTGLGLIICKDFLERHGSVLSVESEVGKGTRFFFTLPVDQDTLN